MRPIVIAAGGTGGHFFPAEALAAELFARGHRVVLMTDGRSGALNSAVFAGREQYVLHGAGIAGRGVMRAAKALVGLAAGMVQARFILRRIDASVVVGFGGYPSVPPILAARTLRARPAIIVQEQNAVLGRANRFLARRADILALGFADTAGIPSASVTHITGNPVRRQIEALMSRRYAVPSGAVELLVLGGSLGARVFSDIVPASIALLPDDIRSRLRVTQQCRVEDLARVRNAYKASGISADLAPFFKDVAGLMAKAHLMIARAGASTCAEIAVAAVPSILVPLPSAIDDHQTANAAALAKAGLAQLVPQSSFTAARLATQIANMLNDAAGLARASASAAACSHPEAAARLADIVESIVQRGALAEGVLA